MNYAAPWAAQGYNFLRVDQNVSVTLVTGLAERALERHWDRIVRRFQSATMPPSQQHVMHDGEAGVILGA